MQDIYLFLVNLPKITKIVFFTALFGIFLSSTIIHLYEDTTYTRLLDNIHWTFGTTAAALLAYLGHRSKKSSDEKKISFWFLMGFGGYAIGQIVWDIQSVFSYEQFPSPSDLFYLWLGPSIMIALVHEISLKKHFINIRSYVLDLLSLSIAALTLILISYLPRKGDLDFLQITVLVGYPITLILPAIMLLLMIPSMRLRLDAILILFITAISVTAWSWMKWNSMALDGMSVDGSWFNITFSIAILIAGLVASEWNLELCHNKEYHQLSNGIVKFIPLFTVLVSSMAIIILTSNPQTSWLVHELIYFGSAIVIGFSIIRQSHLLNEREQLLLAQAEAIKSANLVQTIIQTIPIRIFWKDRNLNYLGCNDLFAHDAGVKNAKDMIGKNDFEMGWKDQAELYRADDFRVMQSNQSTLGYEEPQTTPDGKEIWLRTSKVPLIDETSGETIGILGIYDDITERKTIEEQLHKIAHYDILTNLPNRLLLSEKLHKAMIQSKLNDTMIAVVYLDLDGFKEVNDKYGHTIGDEMLIILSKRLEGLLRPEDTLSRLGGDEFVVIVEKIDNSDEVKPVLDKLLYAVSSPVTLGTITLKVSASIGVTFYPQQGDEMDADQLIRQSDQAMYQAKQSGKNRYHIFDPDHDRALRYYHETLERIRIALENREFILYYQPKVNMRTSAVIGVEALIRWKHPDRGLLPPGAFLPEIENHSLIAELGEWVIESAMQQIEFWHTQGISLPISVNIDNMQLQQEGFVEKIRQLLQKYPNVQHGDLEFEILETSALGDIAFVVNIIAQCRSLGIEFALDDFGTGYSSLTYLKRLPAKTLKIDQSFVFDLLDEPEDLAIIEGILELANTFGRKTIAEGVESIVHGTLLLAMGCDIAQGYAIAKPMDSTEIPKWLFQWHSPDEWSDQKSYSQDYLPLIYAAVEHRAWIKHICEYLTRQHDTFPPTELNHCNFGKWLLTNGKEKFSDSSEYGEITQLHKEIHHHAKGLIEHSILGTTEDIESGIEHLHTLRDELIHKLLQLISQHYKS